MSNVADLGPSPEHAMSRALLPEFFAKVEQQEKGFTDRGLPAEGMTAFTKKWFAAWGNQSVSELRECVTEDCTFIDSTTFQRRSSGRESTLDSCQRAFDAMPDLAFYPQDGTTRSLPYWDHFEGQWRVVIPWRGIGRFSGTVRVPKLEVPLTPTGRCVNFIGIDRYMLTDDFKISHIDTDWDMAYAAIQILPFKTPEARPRLVRTGAAIQRALTPLATRLHPVRPGDGARTYHVPYFL